MNRGGRRLKAPSKLPTIPLLETGKAGPLALLDAAPRRFGEIIEVSRRHYGEVALRLGDVVSRRWLDKTANPYRHEIEAVAARAGRPGAHLLNLSYEWTCTSAVGADPSGPGNRLLRILDWPLDGLGMNVVVGRQEGEAGPYYNITWPGFVGIATAMAPGRFSAALNQPPIRRFSGSCRLDWAIFRVHVWRNEGLPPAHLLRLVFDQCQTYAEARSMLRETPLCLPAFFILGGLAAEESCVIERLENRAAVGDGPGSAANHWQGLKMPGHPRGEDSVGRWRMMERLRADAADDFTWLAPPILNATTKLSVIANAAQKRLLVQGWETIGPATGVFRL